jgi:hypothetical protein
VETIVEQRRAAQARLDSRGFKLTEAAVRKMAKQAGLWFERNPEHGAADYRYSISAGNHPVRFEMYFTSLQDVPAGIGFWAIISSGFKAAFES